jgi:hypothetical protein
VLVVTTLDEVLLLDGKTPRTLAKTGAERVALGPSWVAWIRGTKVSAMRWR